MFLVGLTGGIATGKSTVSRIFSENGVPIVDADLISRQVVEPGKPANKKLRKTFGDEFFFADGHLDRKKLGDIIFNDKTKRTKLNSIIHPYIRWETMKLIFYYAIRCYQFVIVDTPLLFETKFDRIVSKIVVVYCSPEIQLKRLVERDRSTDDYAQSRIHSQMPLEKKLWRAHFVIDNDGNMENTKKQTLLILNQLRQSRTHWVYRFIILGLVFVVFSTIFKFFGTF